MDDLFYFVFYPLMAACCIGIGVMSFKVKRPWWLVAGWFGLAAIHLGMAVFWRVR